MKQKIFIEKESTAPALEEKISITIDLKEVSKYVNLVKRTWPNTRIVNGNLIKYG